MATKADGEAWAQKARSHGYKVAASDTSVAISRRFEPGDVDQYISIENEATYLLFGVPQSRAGSVWGSTSDSVGGSVAVSKGLFVLNKSGVNKNFLKGVKSSTT